jgi:hypothetical protein
MTLRHILQIQPSPLSRELHHAVEVIDRLHRFPEILPVPVVLNRSRRDEGSYHCLSRPCRPVRIEISQFAVRPALTLLHEVGHLLDHMALNPLKGTFGSDYDPAFERLWECWRKSRAVRHLNALATRKRPVVPQDIRRFLLYQVRASELWARTYAQWIALRSDDLLLTSQLRSAREHDPYTQWTGQHFWEDDDFAGIMDAVDELLRQTRLL